MTQVAAFSILALTVGLSLTRPSLGHLRIHPPAAAVIGAMLTVAAGLVPLAGVWEAVRFLAEPILTIASLMMMTLIAEDAGVFRFVAWRVASAARGAGPRLFNYLFGLGALTGALFTNDAAVLVFTPLVCGLVAEIKDDSWREENCLPYYFAALYVANLVGAFVTSNPINIIVATWFGIGFAEYAMWMALPAVVGALTTLVGMRLYFRRMLPSTYRIPQPLSPCAAGARLMQTIAAVMAVTLLGFFTQQLTGIPTAYAAASGAAALAVVHRRVAGAPLAPIVRRIGWDALVFVVAIFIIAHGLRNAGLTTALGALILRAGESIGQLTLVTGFIAGVCSAIMNNHPVAGTMAMVIQDLPVSDIEQRLLALAALIGGDLGPKMLPIGSLAALLWLRILRTNGVEISSWQYVKLGVPVTLAAILLSLVTLNLEFALYLRLR